jgi:hypothetical protein
MPWFGSFCHRLALKILRWRVILRSHPLRVRFVLSFLASVVLLLTFRHYLWIHVLIWVGTISHPIFMAAQEHPTFGRILHVLFNAVPDVAFALLAVAGLAYLVPKRYLDKIEELAWVRIFLLVLFVTFGFSAIIINAIKSENQEFKDGQNDERMGVVLKSVLNIQDALKPKAGNLTEVERREHLLESLRDEYIATHSPIDPEILTGKKMPPDEWLNPKLGELKENWRIHTPPVPHAPAPTLNPVPSISVLGIVTQMPAKAGDDATANIQISVGGGEAMTVNMGELASVYPDFPDNVEAQRGIENTLWGMLEENDKKSGFTPLVLPINNKNMAIPIKQKNIVQEGLDHIKAGDHAFYCMVHIEDLKGKTLLNSCFLVDNKNQIQYCREHNGP